MKAKDIALIGILSATITAGKLALAVVPNVEIVTLFFILYSIVFGVKKTILVSVIFSTTEIMIYGLNTWLLVYYFIWPGLAIVASVIGKKVKSEYGFAILAGVFGLAYGFIFAISESLFYGIGYGITYWVSGLPFDIVHGFSNFILVLLLFKPLKEVLSIQAKRFI